MQKNFIYTISRGMTLLSGLFLKFFIFFTLALESTSHKEALSALLDVGHPIYRGIPYVFI